MSVLKLIGFSDDVEINLAQESLIAQEKILAQASQIKSVDNAFEAQVAADVMKEAAKITKEVEAARKSIKEPVLELGRKIDKASKDFCLQLNAEKTRLSRALGLYQEAQRKIAERARKEAEEAVRKAEAEARMSAGAALIEKGEAAFDEEVKKGAEIVKKAKEEIAEIKSNEPTGLKFVKKKVYEVTDIKKLYESHPDLVTLTDNKSMINAFIKTRDFVPGLKITEEVKSI